MRKMIALLACIFGAYAQGMENNSWSITSYGTKINLTKGSILDADGKVDIIIVGCNHQYLLKEDRMLEGWAVLNSVGDCNYFDCDDVWGEKKDKIEKKEVKFTIKPTSIVVGVVEPCIRYYIDDNHQSYGIYQVRRLNGKLSFYDGKEAVQDLSKCYIYSLKRALPQIEKKEKSIALSALSVDVGIPRIEAAVAATKAVLEFIKNNNLNTNNLGVYDCIELFVKERFEFSLYQELLQKGCKLPTLIVLLYCAAQPDSESIFNVLPRELIHYIAWLI